MNIKANSRLRITQPGPFVYWDGKEVPLTKSQFRTLEALYEAKGQVVTRSRILEYVDSRDATDKLVDVIICHIRMRIRIADPDFQAIETIHGFGYRWTEK